MIKVNVRYDEWNNAMKYRNFDEANELPSIETIKELKELKMNGIYRIEEVKKDIEQPTQKAYDCKVYQLFLFNYNNYKDSIECKDSEEDAIEEATTYKFIAILKED